jgi:ABC-type bacteriocin/lantibiotic exporter with double-glycine peptidase domain
MSPTRHCRQSRAVKKSEPTLLLKAAAGSINLKALSKRYGRAHAVQNVDLDIKAGEFFTLLGLSGAGETSILMTIAGFVVPDDGEILLDGRDIKSVLVERRNLRAVFQNYLATRPVFQNYLATRRDAPPAGRPGFAPRSCAGTAQAQARAAHS